MCVSNQWFQEKCTKYYSNNTENSGSEHSSETDWKEAWITEAVIDSVGGNKLLRIQEYYLIIKNNVFGSRRAAHEECQDCKNDKKKFKKDMFMLRNTRATVLANFPRIQ